MKLILSLVLLLAFSYFSAEAQTASSTLTYQITDVTGKDIATGQLTKNTSVAVNVPTGTYTLRITGAENETVEKNVVIDEAEEINISNPSTEAANPANIKDITTGYIVVKMDNNGTFSYKKMLL